MSSIRRNVIANVAGRAWSTLSIYLFVPFYVDFLGLEAYGFVTLHAMLLSVAMVADLGVKATLGREMARLSSDPSKSQQLRDLLRTLEFPLLGLSLLIAAGLILAAPVLSHRWVLAEQLDQATVIGAFRLIGFSASLFLLSQFYQAGLLGLQRHVLLNVVLIGLGLVRAGGSILVLWLVAPTITSFLACQLVVNGVQAALLGLLLWRRLPQTGRRAGFRAELLRSTWRYAVGMALISLNAAILGQLDRVVVSAWLPLSALGGYGLASQLAQTLVLLVSPLSLVLLPWFTQLVELKRSSQLEAAYYRFSQLAAALAAPTVGVLGLFPEQVLIAWTGDPVLAAQCGGLTAVLAAGSFCLAMQVVPYCLSLAHGWTSLNVALGFASLLVFTPLTAILASRWGAAGCAWSWLGLHATTLLVYVPLLHARLLPGRTGRWYARDIGAPALVALVACLAARWIMPAQLPAGGRLAWLGLTWLSACLAACAAAPEVRLHMFQLARRPLPEIGQPAQSTVAVIHLKSGSTSS